VVLPHVAIVGFEGGLIAYEHIYWDQASLLAQLGVLDDATVPVLGSEQADVLVQHAPRPPS
jgi:carboxymethylenebutenolidase